VEIKELVEKIQSTWEQMKAKNDELIETVKKGGHLTQEDKAMLDKMGNRLDELELKLQRQNIVVPGSTVILDEKKLAVKKAFYGFLRKGKTDMDPTERKALVEDTTGEIVVPEDLEAGITRTLPKIAVMRNLSGNRTTIRDRVRRRSMSEVTMGWGKLETGNSAPESDPTPEDDGYMYVEDLYGLAKIGEDELQDNDINLESLITDSFSRARAETEDTAFAIGTGHTYKQPDGVAVDTDINQVNSDTADTVTPDDVLDLEYELPAQYLNGAAFLMHRKTEKVLRMVRTSGDGTHLTGQYLWQPSLLVGQPNSFDGYPIYNQGDMNYPADALAKNDIIFGNFKVGYRVLDRSGMSIQRLNELYAEDGLVGFRAHFRVGGGVIISDAFRALKNNT